MKAKAPPQGSRRKRPEPDFSQRPYDIAGIVCLALGLVALVSLLIPATGLVGSSLASAVRALFGNGAWIVPPVFMVLGGALLAGRRRLEVSHLGAGLMLVLVSILGILARPYGSDYFDIAAASTSGGYVGAVVGGLFDFLFGQAKFVGIGALMMIGMVLCIPVPLRLLWQQTTARLDTWRRERAEARPSVSEAKPRAVVAASEPETDEAPVPVRKVKPVVRETAPIAAAIDHPVPAEGYQLPPLSLLNEPAAKPKRSAQEMQRNIETLESTLEEFGIEANVVEIANGPTITRYEIQLGPGIRVNRITALADNVAMNLAAGHVRVEAPIPGKAAIGVEVPNAQRSMVSVREVLDTKEFMDHPSRLLIGLGQDVSGMNKYADLTKMPHLLIGGATNSGKSIGLAAAIMSLLVRNTPKDVKFVMIDPKRVELTLFEGIPHLMCPVIRDVKEAPGVFRAVVREMDRRYDLLSENGMRNIDGWNAKASFQDRLPYIVVIVDELADLMIQAKNDVETCIVRIAQLARAVGIHLVIATQRPSVDVITGTIKANIPSRIAFSVSSQIDSRTILDQKGAEDLIGRGDMLFMPIDMSKPLRIQGCYVSEQEIERVCEFWRQQERPAYVLQPIIDSVGEEGSRLTADGDSGETDPLWEDAVTWVIERKQASTSMMQRRFSIGFQRASRLLDQMEERGIVGPRDGPRPREVLVSLADLDLVMGRNVVPGNRGIRDDLLEDEV